MGRIDGGKHPYLKICLTGVLPFVRLHRLSSPEMPLCPLFFRLLRAAPCAVLLEVADPALDPAIGEAEALAEAAAAAEAAAYMDSTLHGPLLGVSGDELPPLDLAPPAMPTSTTPVAATTATISTAVSTTLEPVAEAPGSASGPSFVGAAGRTVSVDSLSTALRGSSPHIAGTSGATASTPTMKGVAAARTTPLLTGAAGPDGAAAGATKVQATRRWPPHRLDTLKSRNKAGASGAAAAAAAGSGAGSSVTGTGANTPMPPAVGGLRSNSSSAALSQQVAGASGGLSPTVHESAAARRTVSAGGGGKHDDFATDETELEVSTDHDEAIALQQRSRTSDAESGKAAAGSRAADKAAATATVPTDRRSDAAKASPTHASTTAGGAASGALGAQLRVQAPKDAPHGSAPVSLEAAATAAAAQRAARQREEEEAAATAALLQRPHHHDAAAGRGDDADSGTGSGPAEAGEHIEISLHDRVAFACRFLDDEQLPEFLDTITAGAWRQSGVLNLHLPVWPLFHFPPCFRLSSFVCRMRGRWPHRRPSAHWPHTHGSTPRATLPGRVR